MTIALYPGSFDPLTYGHLDIAQRAAALFDEVVIAVYATPDKKRVLFTTEERMGLVEESTRLIKYGFFFINFCFDAYRIYYFNSDHGIFY